MRSRVGISDFAMALCIPTSEYTQRDTAPRVRATPEFAETTMSDAVLLDIKDGIALITLNRPGKLNALNYDLIDRLMVALDTIETDAEIGAVILTGAGERAFSAGADITEFSGSVRLGPNAAI